MVGGSLADGGGAERRFLRCAQHLERGGDAHITFMANPELLESAARAGLTSGLEEHRVPVTGLGGWLRLSFSLYTALTRGGYDVIHLPLAQRHLVPLYLLLRLRRPAPVVHSMTASHFAHPVKVPLASRLISWQLWKLAARIDALYDGFVELHARPRGLLAKTSVSPCSFTDDAVFSKPAMKTASIVFSGRLHEEKQPLLFVDALGLLAREPGPAWSAAILGGGPLEVQVRDRIRQLGLQSRVTVTSGADVSGTLRSASVFASLQRIENYPSQSLLEAMTAGAAIVATDVGETHRLVQHGRTGLLVRPEAEAVRDALRELLLDPERARLLGEAARSLVRQHHTVGRFSAYMLSVWQSAATTGASAPVS